MTKQELIAAIEQEESQTVLGLIEKVIVEKKKYPFLNPSTLESDLLESINQAEMGYSISIEEYEKKYNA